MLDTFIIEEIKRQEQSKRREREERQRPRIPLHIPEEDLPRPARQGGEDNPSGRGVIIIDYSI